MAASNKTFKIDLRKSIFVHQVPEREVQSHREQILNLPNNPDGILNVTEFSQLKMLSLRYRLE